VEHGQANKRRGSSIGLTRELDGSGPAAAAATLVPANVWFGLINKQLGEVL
jgi:hypothetical protein